MNTPTQNKPVRCPLWLRILLGASLAFNLLIVGLALGAALRFGGPDGFRLPPSTMGGALIRALPREDRRALFDRAREGHHSDRGARRRDEAKAVGEALRAVPFDPEALTAVVTNQAHRREAFQTALMQVWLTRVEQMSDDGRAAYADRLQDAMIRRHRRPDRD